MRRRRPLVLKLESSPFARTGACQPRNGLPLIRTFGSQTVQRKSNEHLVTVAASSGPAMTMEVSPDYRDSKLRSGPLSSEPYSFVFSLESFSRMNASISGALGASPEQSAVLFFGDREVYRPDAAATLSRSPDCCSGLGSFAVDGHTGNSIFQPEAGAGSLAQNMSSIRSKFGRRSWAPSDIP